MASEESVEVNLRRQVGQGSRFISLTKNAGEFIRSSYLYRWLTAEPEPEIIVIDLRETKTVGPFLRWFDRCITALAPALSTSSLANRFGRLTDRILQGPIRITSWVILLTTGTVLGVEALFGSLSRPQIIVGMLVIILTGIGTQIRLTWSELRETRLFRLIAQALEPPEPPNRQDNVDLRKAKMEPPRDLNERIRNDERNEKDHHN